MLEEPVNVAYMKSVMELTGSRQYNLNGMSVFEVLGSFCARAYDVDDDGVGRICVISSDAVTRGGFLGRRKTGVLKLTLTTDALEHEEKANVPAGLQGLSAFAFPRVIRRIIRHELDLVDIDAVNCHYHLMAMRHDLGIYPALRHYLDQRGDVLGECCSHFRVKKEAAKELFIRLGYGGSVRQWLLDNASVNRPGPFESYLKAFHMELVELRRAEGKCHPALLDELSTRRDPEAPSCFSKRWGGKPGDDRASRHLVITLAASSSCFLGAAAVFGVWYLRETSISPPRGVGHEHREHSPRAPAHRQAREARAGARGLV